MHNYTSNVKRQKLAEKQSTVVLQSGNRHESKTDSELREIDAACVDVFQQMVKARCWCVFEFNNTAVQLRLSQSAKQQCTGHSNNAYAYTESHRSKRAIKGKVKLTMLHETAQAGAHLPLQGLEPTGGKPLMSVMRGQCDARSMITFPATSHHRPLAGTKLYCLVTEARVCVNNLSRLHLTAGQHFTPIFIMYCVAAFVNHND